MLSPSSASVAVVFPQRRKRDSSAADVLFTGAVAVAVVAVDALITTTILVHCHKLLFARCRRHDGKGEAGLDLGHRAHNEGSLLLPQHITVAHPVRDDVVVLAAQVCGDVPVFCCWSPATVVAPLVLAAPAVPVVRDRFIT